MTTNHIDLMARDYYKNDGDMLTALWLGLLALVLVCMFCL